MEEKGLLAADGDDGAGQDVLAVGGQQDKKNTSKSYNGDKLYIELCKY